MSYEDNRFNLMANIEENDNGGVPEEKAYLDTKGLMTP